MDTRTGQWIQEQDNEDKNRTRDTRTGQETQEQEKGHKNRPIDTRKVLQTQEQDKIDTRSMKDNRNKNRIGHETQELLMNA